MRGSNAHNNVSSGRSSRLVMSKVSTLNAQDSSILQDARLKSFSYDKRKGHYEGVRYRSNGLLRRSSGQATAC